PLAAGRLLGRRGLALPADADLLPRVHPGRDADAEGALPRHPPLAAAGVAELADDLPATGARRARRHHAEHPAQPRLLHLPLPAAGLALLRLAPRFGPGAGALLADVQARELDRALAPAQHVLERDRDLGLEVE